MDWLLGDFINRAALAGVAMAFAAGPLGCFVVWRRMAYFGDAAAHAALLGVALSLAASLPPLVGAGVIAAAMGLGVAALARRRIVAADTALGVMAHSALAFGMVAIALTPGVRIDLMAYLFGDVLAVSQSDLALLWGGAAVICGWLVWRWSDLLNATLSEPLALAEGRDVRWARIGLMLALAMVVAVAMRVVGLLLATALLILPAAAARPMARTPEGMALIAAALGAFGALAGLFGALEWDTPAGPSIVAALAFTFLAVIFVGAAKRLWRDFFEEA